MGTPDFAVPALARLISQGHHVAAVYTRAPQPGGRRGLELKPSPVHAAALLFGLDVVTPLTLRVDDAVATLRGFRPDVVVVAAYGLILPKAILDVPPKGCLNLHASLLPRWRGAAPIQRAIMAGDLETGVMVMRMEEGLDTGPVALTERFAIDPDANAGDLTEILAQAGAGLITKALAMLEKDSLIFVPQAEEGVTYAHKIDKAEARIDWQRSAIDLHNLVRGLAPMPGAYFEADLGKGLERVKILRARIAEGTGVAGCVLDEHLTIACGEGALRLIEVQRSGRAPMAAADFLRGVRLPAGTLLTQKSDAAL
ncbi:methionyl-tRNA formyltransferase [Methylocapsa sp. D3K7]|uniref:methionyl-tRNA formyltransferase n=1 Tax=Methylocapsa sp. D3K7 TaxID=3041435 RepID=UPI00244EB4E2|nr:methionyl-tRNA formyltransferase [Methylocapsa sp. D3K7]WGJ16612.1 methionyl-tRNA formyltransferase [Methylocapsa sp. D3K7]